MALPPIARFSLQQSSVHDTCILHQLAQDFAYRLHKVQDKEGEEEARMRPRPR